MTYCKNGLNLYTIKIIIYRLSKVTVEIKIPIIFLVGDCNNCKFSRDLPRRHFSSGVRPLVKLIIWAGAAVWWANYREQKLNWSFKAKASVSCLNYFVKLSSPQPQQAKTREKFALESNQSKKPVFTSWGLLSVVSMLLNQQTYSGSCRVMLVTKPF